MACWSMLMAVGIETKLKIYEICLTSPLIPLQCGEGHLTPHFRLQSYIASLSAGSPQRRGAGDALRRTNLFFFRSGRGRRPVPQFVLRIV